MSNPVHPVKYSFRHSVPLRAALMIVLGLAAAQMIASVHVYLSNVSLHDKMLALREAGYLIVPNSHVLPLLMQWKQAVLGGIFFTLSIGAFLTLLSLAAAWIRYRVLPRGRGVLLVFLVPWLALLIALNMRGFSLMPTLYALVVPPLVFSAASRWLFSRSRGRPRPLIIFHLSAPLLIALLWATQMEGSYFGDVRDYLLLSNSAGTKVSDFYYRYTLYPAETFKSLDQKLIKTVFLKDIQNAALAEALEREFLKHDYLRVRQQKAAELVVVVENQELHFQTEKGIVSSAKLQQFMPSPASWLSQVSAKTDRHGFFRKFTFISLLIGFPLLLYLLVYGLVLLLMSPFVSPGTCSIAATSLCLLVAILLFLLLFHWRAAIRDEGQIARALKSADWRARVAALKFIHDKGLEITRYGAYQDLLESASIPERSWFAKALGASRRSHSFEVLLSLLDDPHPTIVSATFQALEKRKNPAAISHILAAIETSTDWYNQWNAYRALKALGWKQSKST